MRSQVFYIFIQFVRLVLEGFSHLKVNSSTQKRVDELSLNYLTEVQNYK